MTLQDIIKEYLTRYNITGRTFAKKCDDRISYPYIANIIRGYSPSTGEPPKVSDDKLEIIAHGMDMTLEQLRAKMRDEKPIFLHQPPGPIGLKTKVRRESAILLPIDIMPVVEDLVAHAQPSGYLWPRNEPRWYVNYYDALEAAGCRRLEPYCCRRLEPYCCRHTTATRLAVSEGIAPQTIQRIMRWSTTKMLDRYAHPDDAAVRAAADSITRV